MKILLMVDLEGISGIYCRDQVTDGTSRYAEGRNFMTKDINVVAEALKEAEVDEVIVRDCHSGANNVYWEKISPAVDAVISGYIGAQRLFDFEGTDGVILMGYHPMAGTPEGHLEHTWSSANIQNWWLNGVKAGEARVDAAIAGEYGVPVIMVSGDDKLRAEVSEFLPWAEFAQVKRGITWNGAELLPPQKAYALLREKAIAAVKNIDKMKPFTVETPVTLRCELVERGRLPFSNGRDYLKIIDGRTYEVTADKVETALLLV
ncbi:MAG: M55 family metallopeptidase [Clostridiales bacterium]|nr:M55 family metallopeptidase [Clostridiales bacterium]